MAEAEDLDLATTGSSGNKKKWLIYLVIALLVIVLGVTGTMLLTSKDEGDAEGENEGEVVMEHSETFYFPIDTLTVNFNVAGRTRYLQLDIQLMTHDKAVLEAIEMHMPVIRNDMLLILGKQEMTNLSSIEGKEQLRVEIKQAVQHILTQQGEKGIIESVYFTRFIMQ